MIKLFAGQDDFESYLNAKNEAEKVAKSLNFQLKIIDSDEITNIDTLAQELDGLGMFSIGSVFLLKRIFSNKKVVEYLVENYQNLQELTIILWSDGNADGRSKLTQNLKKDGLLFTYELPKERDLKDWVKQESKLLGLKLSESEVEYLVQNIGINKHMLHSELKKIKLFSDNKEQSVTREDLVKILGFDAKGNIWNLLDNFGNRKKKEVIKEFLKLTAFEDNTQYLISMIERELSIISLIKYCEIYKIDKRELKLHPFVLSKSQSKSAKFSWSEVKIFLEKLLNLDFAIKSGDLDEKLAMTLYLLSI